MTVAPTEPSLYDPQAVQSSQSNYHHGGRPSDFASQPVSFQQHGRLADNAAQASRYGTPPPASGYGTPPPIHQTFQTASMYSSNQTPSSGPQYNVYQQAPLPLGGAGFQPARTPSTLPQQQYSAYPEHVNNTPPPPSGNYQGTVPGLDGWNDLPPNLLTSLHQRALGAAASMPHYATSSTASTYGSSRPSSTSNTPQPLDESSANVCPPEQQQHILSAITNVVNYLKSVTSNDPSQSRIIDDSERRMKELEMRLSLGQCAPVTVGLAAQLAEALNNSDWNAANAVVRSLMTMCYDVEGKWILGVKRLIEKRQMC